MKDQKRVVDIIFGIVVVIAAMIILKVACDQKNDGIIYSAGWSSMVARQSHKLQVGGSNPSPARWPVAQLAVAFDC